MRRRVTSALRQLMADLAEKLSAAGLGQTPVRAVAVSGMGETGFVVDAAGTAVAPAFAWFDPRGVEQVEAMPARLRQQFPSRTGLPAGRAGVGGQARPPARPGRGPGRPAVARSAGVRGRAARRQPRRRALAAPPGPGCSTRTPAGRGPRCWTHLGVRADFLPPLVEAGADLGSASVAWLPPQFDGARITVAGHDHLVAAAANGAAADGRYYASIGTAEVLVRILDRPLPAAARERLGENLINYVRHVVPGQYVLVAGVKTGLLMRRILQLAGITDRAGRDRLDAEVLTLPVDGLLGPEAIRGHRSSQRRRRPGRDRAQRRGQPR